MGQTLYVSDLDGTLLGDDGRLSETTAGVLNRLLDAGLLFTCVTGRPFARAAAALQGLRLHLPLAVCNGAAVVHPADGRVLRARAIDKMRLGRLMERFAALGASPMVFARCPAGDRLAWLRDTDAPGVLRYVAGYPEPAHLFPADRYDQLLEGEVYQVSLKGGKVQMEELQRLVAMENHLMQHLQQDDYHPDEYWLEIIRCDADKGQALRHLKKLTGVDRVVCFGDNMNDLPMFEAADQSCAVANACPAALAAANCVIGRNSADGVARWLAENVQAV